MSRLYVTLSVAFLLVTASTLEAGRRRAVRTPEAPLLRFASDTQVTVNLGQSVALDTPEEGLSLDAWVYRTGPLQVGRFAPLLERNGPSGTVLWWALAGESDGTSLHLSRVDPFGFCCQGIRADRIELPLRTWVHLAAVISPTTTRLYVNGQQRASQAFSGLPQFSGSRQLFIGRFLPGVLSEVRIWHRVLSAAEISSIVSSREVSSTGLAAHWPMHEGTGQVVRDHGPHQLHGMLGESDGEDANDPFWIDAAVLRKSPWFELSYLPAPADRARLNGRGFAADINGDQKTDYFILAAVPDDRFTCFYPFYDGAKPEQGAQWVNSGSGAFSSSAPVIDYETFGSNGHRMFLADFTGDGRKDLFVADTGSERGVFVGCPYPASTFPGGQSRLFVSRPGMPLREETTERLPVRVAYDHGVAVGDIDGDQDLDILMLGDQPLDFDCATAPPKHPCSTILVNDGAGKFTADFTRLPSFVTTRRYGDGTTTGTFFAAAFLDVERDGDLDIVLGNNRGGVSHDPLLLNDGTGRFALASKSLPERTYANLDPVTELVAADLDGDGWQDLMETTQSSTRVRLYFNLHDGTFRAEDDATGPARPTLGCTCRAVDLNADGALDMLCRDVDLRIFYNRGDGTFEQMAHADDFPRQLVDLEAADLDGDGDMDLIGGAPEGPRVWLQVRPYTPGQ